MRSWDGDLWAVGRLTLRPAGILLGPCSTVPPSHLFTALPCTPAAAMTAFPPCQGSPPTLNLRSSSVYSLVSTHKSFCKKGLQHHNDQGLILPFVTCEMEGGGMHRQPGGEGPRCEVPLGVLQPAGELLEGRGWETALQQPQQSGQAAAVRAGRGPHAPPGCRAQLGHPHPHHAAMPNEGPEVLKTKRDIFVFYRGGCSHPALAEKFVWG